MALHRVAGPPPALTAVDPESNMSVHVRLPAARIATWPFASTEAESSPLRWILRLAGCTATRSPGDHMARASLPLLVRSQGLLPAPAVFATECVLVLESPTGLPMLAS